jgi:RimJ/RimL family protein N-acetyltransferase
MIKVVHLEPWTRRHRSLFERWPAETNLLLPALLLRGPGEPYDVEPITLAVMYNNALVGRFSIRVTDAGAYVGYALNVSCRGVGLGIPTMRAGLGYCANTLSCRFAWGSVAAANRPALMADFACGFAIVGESDWRLLPADFDISLLDRLKSGTYRLLPDPAVLYYRVECNLYQYTYHSPLVARVDDD